MPHVRFDRAELRKPRRTAEGYLVVDGIAATPGIYVYRDGSGRTRRELVPSATLARADDLATLALKPVTRGHHGLLEPGTVGAHGAGAVGERPYYDDGVCVSMAIHRADAIAAVEAGEHELSCGYTVTDLDETPGEDPVFGAYDAVQRGRAYNHLAIVPRGRSGREAAIRLDADDAIDQRLEAPLHPSILALIACGVLREDGDAVVVRLDAEWGAAYINDLPDSAFLYVEPGGEKDADGKTTPRSLRHFPVKDSSGSVDLPHLRNALARIPQSKVPDDAKAAATKEAQAMLEAAKERADSASDALSALLQTLGVATVDEARMLLDQKWSMLCAAKDALYALHTLVGAESAEAAKVAIEGMRADNERMKMELGKRQDAAPTDAALLAYSEERTPLLDRARELGIATDGQTNVALRKAIATTIEPGARQDGSDDYYAGILLTKREDPWANFRARPVRQDGILQRPGDVAAVESAFEARRKAATS